MDKEKERDIEEILAYDRHINKLWEKEYYIPAFPEII